MKLEDVATPSPSDNEILIRVRAASINLGDWELLIGRPLFISVLAHLFSHEQQYKFTPTSVTAEKGGIFPPKAKILGTDIAGSVEAVGQVTEIGIIGNTVCLPPVRHASFKTDALIGANRRIQPNSCVEGPDLTVWQKRIVRDLY